MMKHIESQSSSRSARPPPHGIIAALATPLDGDERVDAPSIARLIRHVIDGGVNGVLVLGATGEGPALNLRERQRMVELTVEQVGGRVPVITGVCEAGVSNAVDFSRASARAGVDAVLVSAPYFFTHAAADISERYFSTIADASVVPVWIYNAPAHVHLMLNAQWIARLGQHPNIVAVKDSSGDFTHFQELLARAKDDRNFAIYQGVGYHLAASVRIGARGGIVGLANLMPRFFVALYQAARQGQAGVTDQLQAALMEYRQIIAATPHQSIPLAKAALEMLGLCGGRCTRPFAEADADQRDAMRSFMERCLRLCDMQIPSNPI